jgi:hypothetical protein
MVRQAHHALTPQHIQDAILSLSKEQTDEDLYQRNQRE